MVLCGRVLAAGFSIRHHLSRQPAFLGASFPRIWTRPGSSQAESRKRKILQLQRICTVPNAISTGRIALTPFIGYAVLTDRPLVATGLAVACGISDALDGWIARTWKQQSALGSLLDPVSDKILVSVLAGTLLWKGLIPGWLVFLFLTRDFALIVTGIWMRWRMLPHPRSFSRFFDPSTATATISPTMVSKVNTILQLVVLSLALTGRFFLSEAVLQFLSPTLHYCAATTTIWSACQYIKDYRNVVRIVKK